MSRLLSGRTLIDRLFRRSSRPDLRVRPAKEVMIVRRGMSSDYYFYLQKFAIANDVELVQDRRVDNRRRWPRHVHTERRNSDRRGPLPMTWETGDFVAIPAHGGGE